MNNTRILRLARECGGSIEFGAGDEPTTCGMMFWQGAHMYDYPALFAFGEAIRREERERLQKCYARKFVAGRKSLEE